MPFSAIRRFLWRTAVYRARPRLEDVAVHEEVMPANRRASSPTVPPSGPPPAAPKPSLGGIRMKHRVLAVAALAALMAFLFTGVHTATQRAHAGTIDPEMNDEQDRLLSGFASFELSQQSGESNSNEHPTTYFPRGSDACPNNLSSNIKVNQNCLNLSDPNLQGRGQAQNEEFIKVNPNNTNQVVASYNDYRRGDGTCGLDYSSDGGRTWNDATIPNNFVRGDNINRAPRDYMQASGDTSVDWDSKGNAYLSCQMFKRGRATTGDPEQSSGLYVFRSTLNGGASWNFPGRPVVETPPRSGCTPGGGGTAGCGQTSFLPLEDKQYIAVDHNNTKCPSTQTTANPGSTCTPFQDRVYITWTEFAPN